MSENRSKIVISTISDEVEARTNQMNSHESSNSSQLRHEISPTKSISNRSSLNNERNNNSENRKRSFKRQSRKNQRPESGVESIVLQENERRPVTLKASFLRRKIEEYEGNTHYCYFWSVFYLHFVIVQQFVY